MKRLQWVQFMAKNMANKIGIDTNVLVRYIMQDDEQSKIATEFLESLSIENQAVINTHWVAFGLSALFQFFFYWHFF